MRIPLQLISPATSNLALGEVVPIPTLPSAKILILSELSVLNINPFASFAVTSVTPFVVFTPPKLPQLSPYPSNSLVVELYLIKPSFVVDGLCSCVPAGILIASVPITSKV